MSRKRCVQVVVSLEKANEMLAKAGELARQIEEIDVRLERRTARLKDAATEAVKRLKKELDALKKPLFEFYVANEHLLEGDARTLTLSTGTLLMRTGNWTAHIDSDVESDPEQFLPEWALRRTVEVNRQALVERRDESVTLRGVDIDRTDRLHLQPNGMKTGVEGSSRKIRYTPPSAA